MGVRQKAEVECPLEEQPEKSGGAGHMPEEDRKCMCRDLKGGESLAWSRRSEEGWMSGWRERGTGRR